MTTQTIDIIPLNKLRLSPHNVRKTGAEDNLDELEANVEANGILQNLIGGTAKKKGFFDIFAGGRRLRVLNRLAVKGKIAKDYGVPVRVVEQSAEGVAETSLAENFIRLGMTPTDECKAFQHFLGADGDIDAVAKRFGQTRRFVEGRLRLATLADPIFDCLAAGEMTMEVAKAYAATHDQAKQLAVFEEVRNSWVATNAHEIRRRILGASIPASHPVARLVGEEAYAAAGGRVVRDLFTEAEAAEWLDGDLAMELGTALMTEAAAAQAASSGIGTVVPLLADASSWSDREELIHARLDREPLGEEANVRIAAIQDELAEIEARCEEQELDEDEIEAVNQEIAALEAEEAELRNTPVTIDEERKAGLTQFIVIGKDGKPALEPTYWEARPQYRSSGSSAPASPAKVAAKEQGLSSTLADELAMARRDVLALHVAGDPALALDLAIFTLAERAVKAHRDCGLSLAVNSRNDPISRNGLPASPAGTAMAEMRSKLDLTWSDHAAAAERFDAFRALDEEMRANWLAVLVASSIEASIGGKALARHNPFHDHLGQLLEINVADWWRPTAGSYFLRVRKAGMQRALSQIGGPVLAAKYASAKSADMAEACEKLCAGGAITEPEIREVGLAWLPSAMRFDAVEDPPSEGTDAGGDAQTGENARNDAAVAAMLTDGDEVTAAGGDVAGSAGEGAPAQEPGPNPIAYILAPYEALKEEAGDALLLFRMGDFYEAFGGDAAILAKALDLALTQRGSGKHLVAMAGIPVHAAEPHIAQLTAAGHTVAIAEKCEDGEHAIVRIADAQGEALRGAGRSAKSGARAEAEALSEAAA